MSHPEKPHHINKDKHNHGHDSMLNSPGIPLSQAPTITLQHLTSNLIQQESKLGKYNQAVSLAYRMIGKFYLSHLDDSVRAILMMRESHRIDMILYGTMTAGTLCPPMRTALDKRGLKRLKGNPSLTTGSTSNRIKKM